MIKFKSISTEIVVYLLSALSIILLIVASLFIDKVSQESKEKAELGLINALKIQSDHIESFFERHAARIETVVSSPQLVDWFDNYRERNVDLSNDEYFPKLIKLFANLSADEETKAVFFASANTGEYFDNSNGRYNDDSYDARKRPWWGEAMDNDKMFVTQPEEDYVDKTIVTSVKRSVYNSSNELIGIAGIDILISTIENKVRDDLKYQGVGEAFLINRDGRIILFPSENSEIKVDSQIAGVDNILSDSEGFSQLYNNIERSDDGITDVTWNGEKHIVAFTRISSEFPYFDWVAGIIVPTALVDDPINESITSAIIASASILLVIALLVFLIAKRIVAPLNRLVDAIKDVAEGDNDLTKRLIVSDENEVSQFSHQFNVFVEHIQEIMILNKQTVEDLYEDAERISTVANLTSKQASEQRDATDMVATAAEQLSYSVKDISDNTSAASNSASEAEKQIVTGVEVVHEATSSIRTLADTVGQISGVVDNLNQDSNKIGGVLEVIQGIAEQTNLLALNAAIEAARAGDQGRGFAVVADEVRTLASRTQESTQIIEQIIGNLQQSAKTVVESMVQGTEQAEMGVEKSEMVQSVLESISTAIINIQSQSTEIANATHEQAKAAQEITERATSIRNLSEKTEEQISDVQAGTRKQREGIHSLSELVKRFKI